MESYIKNVKEIQAFMQRMESNNATMKDISDKLLTDWKVQNSNLATEEINSMITQNGQMQKKIKKKLDDMNDDIAASVRDYSKEPETNIKKTIYRTMTSKFRDVLRTSQ